MKMWWPFFLMNQPLKVRKELFLGLVLITIQQHTLWHEMTISLATPCGWD